jgi:hypothetical protein
VRMRMVMEPPCGIGGWDEYTLLRSDRGSKVGRGNGEVDS